MAFVAEDVPDQGPAELADEHARLAAWLKASHFRARDPLYHRMVDRASSAALYRIDGFGMGEGERFALVRGDAIYEVSVFRGDRRPGQGHAAARVLVVSSPESAPMSRGAIETMLTDAVLAYCRAHADAMLLGFSTSTAAVTLDWSGARWEVRPRPYSLLYWRTRWSKRWWDFRRRLWPRIWLTTTSPLVAALSLAATAWTGGGWPTALSGVWLSLRMLQYQPELRLDAWMIGWFKLRDPLGHLRMMARILDPQPLAALTVRVEHIEGEPGMRLVRVVNRSWVPVPYVNVGSHSLARLLAPGLLEQLRQQMPGRAIAAEEIERLFPKMVKKWLWPGQSFARRYHLRADFPPSSRPRQVEASVNISRFVSGEPRRGPATFMLDVEVLPPRVA